MFMGKNNNRMFTIHLAKTIQISTLHCETPCANVESCFCEEVCYDISVLREVSTSGNRPLTTKHVREES